MPIEEKLESLTKQMEREFKIALLERNMTQVDLAKLLGLNKVQINKAIKGGTNPGDIEVRKKLYKVLGMNK